MINQQAIHALRGQKEGTFKELKHAKREVPQGLTLCGPKLIFDVTSSHPSYGLRSHLETSFFMSTKLQTSFTKSVTLAYRIEEQK